MILSGRYGYLPRRGRNERTAVERAKGTNGLLVILGDVCKLPKPAGTTRRTAWPVSRSIARIDSSSIGDTIEIALP